MRFSRREDFWIIVAARERLRREDDCISRGYQRSRAGFGGACADRYVQHVRESGERDAFSRSRARWWRRCFEVQLATPPRPVKEAQFLLALRVPAAIPGDCASGNNALTVTKKGRRKRNDELRGVLNSGHRKATARVIRHRDSRVKTQSRLAPVTPLGIAAVLRGRNARPQRGDLSPTDRSTGCPGKK